MQREKKHSREETAVVSQQKRIDEICRQTGLSQHMLHVLLDEHPVVARGRKKTNPLDSAFLIKCPNAAIRSLAKEVLDRHRQEMLHSKEKSRRQKTGDGTATRQQSHSDDQVRKYLLEQREAELKQESMLVSGSTKERERLSPIERDFRMIDEFVGHAKTLGGYLIFVYYVGPEQKGRDNRELRKLENWQPVPKSHLAHFHRDLATRVASCLSHSSQDQREMSDCSKNPAYDPRFIVHHWLATAQGKKHKQLILDNRELFGQQKDYLTKYHEEHQRASLDKFPHYYDPDHDDSEEDDDEVVVTVLDQPGGSSSSRKRTQQERDVETERQRQSELGFEVTDDSYRTLGHDECARLSSMPLPRETHYGLEQLAELTRHFYPLKDAKREFYANFQPIELVKAAAIAFNPDAHAKRAVSEICDRHLQIIERDQAEPLLLQLMENEEARASIKEATAEFVWACFALDLAGLPPPPIERLLEKRKEHAIVLLGEQEQENLSV